MNVYYLPTRQQNDTPALPLTASRWSLLQARAHRAWWRMRLTVAELYVRAPSCRPQSAGRSRLVRGR